MIGRDGDHRSPSAEKRATILADEFAANGTTKRALLVRLLLAPHWECTPEHVQQAWPDDEPLAGNRLRYSGLPDPEVAYQLVLRRTSGVVEAQTELVSDAKSALAFVARDLPGALFKGAVRKTEVLQAGHAG